MKTALVLLTFLTAAISFAQNQDVVGTWVAYDVSPAKSKKQVITDSMKVNFYSAITFTEDSTFTLVTSGAMVVRGQYQVRNGMLTLYLYTEGTALDRFWDIMWNGSDPNPETPDVFDFYIRTQSKVKHKKKEKYFTADVYALYKRTLAESDEEDQEEESESE